jgi:hypothetical protein
MEEIQVNGVAALLPRLGNGYLLVMEPPSGAPFTVSFPLARQEIVLRYRNRSVRARLAGDAVTQMEDFGQDLTFFDPLS